MATASIDVAGFPCLSDPVLRSADWHCVYCGRDLLADLDTFLTIVRDHVLARRFAGPDHVKNLAASCAACDRIKGGAHTETIEAARTLIEDRRARRLAKYHTVRRVVRGEGGAI